MAETTEALIGDDTFAAFVVALDQRTWPDGERRIVPITKRQLQAVREAMEEILPALRGRWAAEVLEEVAAEPGPVQRVARVLLQERAAEYRSGAR